MRAERPFDRLSVDDPWTRPTLRRAKHDGRPGGSLSDVGCATFACVSLNGADALVASVERARQLLVDDHWIVAVDEMRVVAVAAKQARHIGVVGAPEDRRPADLVAIEMQNGQYGAVARRIQKTRTLPRS